MNGDCTERLLHFACEGEPLIGVLSEPAGGAAAGAAALLIVVGGPQYRVGAHRQFVKLARALAVAGHPTLRFDVRGMGDGGGAQRSFESLTPDIGAAADALWQALPAQPPLVLFGLCDGASAAMLYLDERHDPRVVGLCAANPWARTEAGQAKTQLKHYYLQRLASGQFWRKMLKGGVGLAALRELGNKLAVLLHRREAVDDGLALPYTERMARGCATLPPSHLALALSGEDLTAREFEGYCATSARWRSLLEAKPAIWRFANMDHTFSQPQATPALVADLRNWLQIFTVRASCTAAPH